MSEPWAVYILIFVLVAVAVHQLQLGLRGLTRSRRERASRFASLGRVAASEDLDTLRRRSSRLGRSALAARMSRLIVQSGTGLSLPSLGTIWLGLTLMSWLVLPAPAISALRLIIAAIGSALVFVLWLRIKRARRMARFGEQLPEVIDVIVRSLRAGHPLAVSLGLVARETPDPAGAEFALVVDEVSYGRSLSEALENLYQRVGYPELRFFVASTAIAHQTGGNLGEILVAPLAHAAGAVPTGAARAGAVGGGALQRLCAQHPPAGPVRSDQRRERVLLRRILDDAGRRAGRRGQHRPPRDRELPHLPSRQLQGVSRCPAPPRRCY